MRTLLRCDPFNMATASRLTLQQVLHAIDDSDDSDDEEKEPMALVFGKDLDFFFEKKREIFVPHPFTRIFTNSFGQFIHFMD